MRVFILALDGLEYELVMGWKLHNLMQEHCGKYRAPISPRYGKPHTPSAWVSFITGLPPEEHGIDDWWKWGRLLDWIRLHPPFRWIKNKRVIAAALGIKPKTYTREDLRVETIFDAVKPSIALFVPGYNEPPEPHYELNEALRRGIREYERKIWEIHNWRVSKLTERLNDEWRLFMVWLDLADLLGHIYIVKNRARLLKAYWELDWLAGWLRAKLLSEDPHTAFLIVSDHGMQVSDDGVTGDHSPHGFWSSNVPLPREPKEITDFRDIILELVGVVR